MRGRIVLIVCGLLFVASGKPCFAEDRLRVGFIGASTGQGASYGIAARRGIELALEDLGASARMEVRYEDDMFDKKQSLSALRKLLDEDSVEFIITLGSSVSNATAPIANERGVPYVTWASDPGVSAGRKFVLRMCPPGPAIGVRTAELLKERSEMPVALFISQHEYTRSVADGVRSVLGSTILVEEEVELEQRDFRSALTRLRKMQPKAVFVCLLPGQLSLFARQYRSLALPWPLAGCETMNDYAEFNAAAGTLDGAWFLTTAVDPEFQRRLVKRYGDSAVASAAALNYDIVMRLQEALATPSGSRQLRGLLLVESLFKTSKRTGVAGITEFKEDRFGEAGIDRYLDVELMQIQLSKEFFLK